MSYRYFFTVLFLLISCQEKKTKTGSVKQASSSVEYEVSAGVLEPKRNRIKIQNVKKGERLVQRFILSNTGTEMVRILRNDASCNCTEVLISKKGKCCKKYDTFNKVDISVRLSVVEAS
ncbi:hypothetical protein CGC49_00205 [Capnocytophaga sp. H4358]|uniref:DUF1573 domain-containing protein n=1 Tax=Capnocytophaga sp. H4358 TaxID=1945658 RepID=UPI000BB1AA14|nr:DUF1573 domain-containing protein [Capnocytophaga sp. H4358]ATA71873.1 hypothetical protein CGC49_00205 [Capnocytophaga sp. H4358]